MCKVCNQPSPFFANAQIMGKYHVNYFRCNLCGMVETEDPFWLNEAYSEAIAQADIGLVGRNVRLARVTSVLLKILFSKARNFVDYGGGYGMFVRLMRDAGFNFFRHDKYCSNLFAKGFDVEPNASQAFDLLTAFEVFEHLVDPAIELAKMLALSPNILFTTGIMRENDPPKPAEWWYYTRQSGQHVTLYTRRSLRILAGKHNLRLCSVGDLHLFTKSEIPNWLFRSLIRISRPTSQLLPKRKSLLAQDYLKLTGEVIG
jgi:hypothetical protein